MQTPYQGEALLVIDLEVTGHGRDKKRNCIIAGGMCVVELEKLHASFREKGIDATLDNDALLSIIPKENRFCEYIHDDGALNELASFVQSKGVWAEIPGREFWLSPFNDKMKTALAKMKASKLSPDDFAYYVHKWITEMTVRYPKLLLVCDTSNFDCAWLDHYFNKIGLPSLNYVTNKYVMPIDATSYYFGLLGHTASFAAWDNLSSTSELKKAGFLIPDTSAALDESLHDPLIDAMNIAIKFGAVTFQVRARQQRSEKD